MAVSSKQSCRISVTQPTAYARKPTCNMMKSSNENIFSVTGPLCGKYRRIPFTEASNTELWCWTTVVLPSAIFQTALDFAEFTRAIYSHADILFGELNIQRANCAPDDTKYTSRLRNWVRIANIFKRDALHNLVHYDIFYIWNLRNSCRNNFA